MVIEEPGGHLLAARLTVVVVTALAAVPPGQPLPAGLILHLQAVTADPADHQPAQQRRAVARRSGRVGAGPVGGQPCLVPLVLLHADIGRQRAVDADQPLPGLQPAHPAGVLTAGQPPGRISAAAPVSVAPHAPCPAHRTAGTPAARPPGLAHRDPGPPPRRPGGHTRPAAEPPAPRGRPWPAAPTPSAA